MLRSSKLHPGFTLVELLAAIVVMSIISVTLMPVIGGASESYVIAREARSSTEHASFALDRITRIVREAPIGAGQSGVGILNATSSGVAFDDGTGIQLVGTTLEMLVPGENAVPLCFDVNAFTIQYIGNDGMSNTILSPTLTHRFAFTIQVSGIEMSVLVHPRVWIGQ